MIGAHHWTLSAQMQMNSSQMKNIITKSRDNGPKKQPDTKELCRRCGKESETIQHITAACEQLAPTEYVKRHDGLAKIIHQKLAEAAELIDDKSPYYKHTPANVLKNENFKLCWNGSVLTDKTIPFNRPDMTFMNKKTKNTFSIIKFFILTFIKKKSEKKWECLACPSQVPFNVSIYYGFVIFQPFYI